MEGIVFLCDSDKNVDSVYALGRREKIEKYAKKSIPVIGRNNIEKNIERLKDVEYAFSTWGMPNFTVEEYRKYLPSLKYIFYAAGTVKSFAENVFDAGIRLFSARASNAIPVAETVFAQIILANKGFFNTLNKETYESKKDSAMCFSGNFESTVGIVGVGVIGKLLIEKLKRTDLKILVWDKFLTIEDAEKLGVEKVGLKELFLRCDVISNHLADKPETERILNYEYFSLMKNHAVFINSGRGKQIVEDDLVKALKEKESRFAILDVTFPEPPTADNPLMNMDNVILTPHIDGSSGNEVVRMADEMIGAFEKVVNGEPVENEVFKYMLSNMA